MNIRNKLEYTLNAVYFGTYLINKNKARFFSLYFDKILFTILKFILPRKRWFKMFRYWVKQSRIADDFFKDPNNGLCSHLAMVWYGGVSTCYFIPITFLSWGIIDTTGINNVMSEFGQNILAFTPTVLGYILFVDRLVFRKDKYLKYSKKFMKKDRRWKRFWMKMSFLYSIGGFAFLILGVLLLTLISSL